MWQQFFFYIIIWMDTCTPVSSIDEDFGQCVDNTYFCSKLTFLGPKRRDTYDSAKKNARGLPVEVLSDPQGCLIDEEIGELGIAFNGLLVEDFVVHSSGDKLSSELVCDLKDDSGCLKDSKQKIAQLDASEGNMKKGLSKSASFPCSEKMWPSLVPVDEGEMHPSTTLHPHCSLKSGNIVYERSTSLPATPKLVSAMKGGREKDGAPPKTKLKVKWDPDVYDPPATSMSHTVRNHHQRPKPKRKDYHKHKHKNKASRGNARDKKHANQSHVGGITNSLYPRVQAPESGSVLDVCGQTSIRVLNYAANSPESKCGSSVLVGSLAKVQFSIAEAT